MLQTGCFDSDVEKVKKFYKWVFSIGDKTITEPNNWDVSIQISNDVLISDIVIQSLQFWISHGN